MIKKIRLGSQVTGNKSSKKLFSLHMINIQKKFIHKMKFYIRIS